MLRILLACFAFLALGSCGPSPSPGVIVLAASSLQAPLEDLAEQWEARGHDAPVFSFASSAALARQVETDAAADIFISADRQWTDYLLANAPALREQARTVATNRLVVGRHVSDQAAPVAASDLSSLLAEGRIATGDPDAVPLGRYAREALEAAGAWNEASPRLVYAQSARAAFRLVARGEAPTGILYASDVSQTDKVEAVFTFDAASHSPIEYIAVQLPASGHPEATEFLAFLASADAAATFERYGFGRP